MTASTSVLVVTVTPEAAARVTELGMQAELEQMLDPARRAACAQAARRTAAQWTFEQHYREMLAVLAEAAARKQVA